MAIIPPAIESDSDEVSLALRTAATHAERGQGFDALIWLRKAAIVAADTDESRSLALAVSAAEYADILYQEEQDDDSLLSVEVDTSGFSPAVRESDSQSRSHRTADAGELDADYLDVSELDASELDVGELDAGDLDAGDLLPIAAIPHFTPRTKGVGEQRAKPGTGPQPTGPISTPASSIGVLGPDDMLQSDSEVSVQKPGAQSSDPFRGALGKHSTPPKRDSTGGAEDASWEILSGAVEPPDDLSGFGELFHLEEDSSRPTDVTLPPSASKIPPPPARPSRAPLPIPQRSEEPAAAFLAQRVSWKPEPFVENRRASRNSVAPKSSRRPPALVFDDPLVPDGEEEQLPKLRVPSLPSIDASTGASLSTATIPRGIPFEPTVVSESLDGDDARDKARDKAEDKAHDKARDDACNKADDNARDKADDKADGSTDDKADDKADDQTDDTVRDSAGDKPQDNAADNAGDNVGDNVGEEAGDDTIQNVNVNVPGCWRADLSCVEEFADMHEATREDFENKATLHELNSDEEVSGFALAWIDSGKVAVMSLVSDTPAATLERGQVFLSRGTIDRRTPTRLVCVSKQARVATWSDEVADKLLDDLPWVAEELRTTADWMHAFVGVTLGPLGDSLGQVVLGEVTRRLECRRCEPAEVIVVVGGAVPGLMILGVGSLEVMDAKGEVQSTLEDGMILFSRELVAMGDAPSTVRAGPQGAVVLMADRTTAQEMMLTYPSLLEQLISS